MWYPSSPADTSTSSTDLDRLDPELDFDREVYPLGVSPAAGVIVGISQRLALSACADMPCFEPIPQAQPILPCLLRHLLQVRSGITVLDEGTPGFGIVGFDNHRVLRRLQASRSQCYAVVTRAGFKRAIIICCRLSRGCHICGFHSSNACREGGSSTAFPVPHVSFADLHTSKRDIIRCGLYWPFGHVPASNPP